MRPSRFIGLILFALGSAGCGSSAIMPAKDQIDKVWITVARFPGKADLKPPAVAAFTEEDEIAEIVAWLGQIDWSQSGQDLTAAKLPQPDGEIEITTKDGELTRYGFFWDGRFVNSGANRLIQAGGMAQLEKIFRRNAR
jgi:hypothetical protein